MNPPQMFNSPFAASPTNFLEQLGSLAARLHLLPEEKQKKVRVKEPRVPKITWLGAASTVQLARPLPIPPVLSVERIKDVLSTGDIQTARRLMDQAHKDWPEDEGLKRLARMVEPPRVVAVRSNSSGTDHEANRRWIRDHASQHRGSWVAVHDGHLLGVAPSVSELRALVGDTKGVLVTKIA